MLKKEFYLQDTAKIAEELIGTTLVKIENSNLIAGKIVETEAYLSENDEASHSFSGKSKRNAPMFEEGGILYVYLIYGVHHCINIVTEEQWKGCAVLIRAIEPIEGIEIMQKNRQIDNINLLGKGPGNTAKALNFTRNDNYSSLTSEKLHIIERKSSVEIGKSERIGISKSKELQLRFFDLNSKFVSGKKTM